jgi:aspartate/methionine/tyrosine aminotransferase
MGKGNSADNANGSQRFMRAMGKLRVVLGPANRSSLVHDMTEENRALLVQRERETQQWETVTRPDGSTYVVPRNPGDQSLR